MKARFIFAETVYSYEHTTPHFVTRDLQLPDGFVPLCTMGTSKRPPDGELEAHYAPMDPKGVEIIDETEKDAIKS